VLISSQGMKVKHVPVPLAIIEIVDRDARLVLYGTIAAPLVQLSRMKLKNVLMMLHSARIAKHFTIHISLRARHAIDPSCSPHVALHAQPSLETINAPIPSNVDNSKAGIDNGFKHLFSTFLSEFT